MSRRREARAAPDRRATRAAIGLLAALLLLPSSRAGGAGAAELVSAGNRSYAQGELAEAAAGYEKARQAAPGQAVPLYNLGVVLYQQGNLAAALAAFQSIPASPPALAARLHYNQGNTLARLGRLAQEEQPQQALALFLRSLGAYRRALELESGNREAAVNLEVVRGWVAELTSRLAQAPALPAQGAPGTPAPGAGGTPQAPPASPPPTQDPVVEEPAPWELPDESAQAILREESARRETEQSRGGRLADDYPAW
jgi:tetratricopeptide (TPR) repeat protein